MDKTWDAAATRLLELTESGGIRWEVTHRVPCNYGNDAELVGVGYVATVEGKRIAVYEYRFRFYTDADEWHWDTDVAIEFVDKNNDLEWAWPAPQNRRRLLDAIRYQQCGADHFLDKLLTAGVA